MTTVDFGLDWTMSVDDSNDIYRYRRLSDDTAVVWQKWVRDVDFPHLGRWEPCENPFISNSRELE